MSEPLKVGDPITAIVLFKGEAKALATVVTGLDKLQFHHRAAGVILGTLLYDAEGRTWIRGHDVETAQAFLATWLLKGRP